MTLAAVLLAGIKEVAMFYNAHNGSVCAGNSEMDYVSFGNGNKNLIMLPGLGDGLATVKGMAFFFQ